MTKIILAAVGFLALAIAVFVYLAMYYPARTDAIPRQAVVSRGDDGQAARLAQQVEDLQRSLNALKSQMPQHGEGAARAVPTSDTKPAEQLSVEEQRAQDRERMRTYMAGVEQSFANEKVDAAWASGASSRVATTFDGDDVLKGVSRTVECRSQTCRVQIEDDGSGQLARRMPFVAIGLADLLPTISAEHIEHGNGRGATVLYMSSQRTQPSTSGK
jgi:hypothetical protein